jgi:hypothetical protein
MIIQIKILGSIKLNEGSDNRLIDIKDKIFIELEDFDLINQSDKFKQQNLVNLINSIKPKLNNYFTSNKVSNLSVYDIDITEVYEIEETHTTAQLHEISNFITGNEYQDHLNKIQSRANDRILQSQIDFISEVLDNKIHNLNFDTIQKEIKGKNITFKRVRDKIIKNLKALNELELPHKNSRKAYIKQKENKANNNKKALIDLLDLKKDKPIPTISTKSMDSLILFREQKLEKSITKKEEVIDKINEIDNAISKTKDDKKSSKTKTKKKDNNTKPKPK